MIDIRLDGSQKLRANIRNLQGHMSVLVTNAVARDLASAGARWARAHQGFNNITWKAHRSIRIEQSRSRGGQFESGYALVFGNRRAFYAVFLERGTRHIRARRTIARTIRYLQQRGLPIAARAARRELARARRR